MKIDPVRTEGSQASATAEAGSAGSMEAEATPVVCEEVVEEPDREKMVEA